MREAAAWYERARRGGVGWPPSSSPAPSSISRSIDMTRSCRTARHRARRRFASARSWPAARPGRGYRRDGGGARRLCGRPRGHAGAEYALARAYMQQYPLRGSGGAHGTTLRTSLHDEPVRASSPSSRPACLGHPAAGRSDGVRAETGHRVGRCRGRPETRCSKLDVPRAREPPHAERSTRPARPIWRCSKRRRSRSAAGPGSPWPVDPGRAAGGI